MHFFSFSFLLLTSSLLSDAATPTTVNTTPGTTVGIGFEASVRAQEADPKNKYCYVYRKKIQYHDGSTQYITQPGDGLKECVDQCTAMNGPQKADQTITCGSPPGTAPLYNDNASLPDGMQSAPLPCNCDDKVIGTFGKAFIDSLPKLGAVICEAWVATLSGLIDFCIDSAIDSVDQAINSMKSIGDIQQSHKDIIQTALQIQHATADMDKGKDAFGKWIASKACDVGQLSEDQSNAIFKAAYDVSNLLVTAATLPAGGEVLDVFRLVGDLPKMIDGTDLLASIPKDWPSPKLKPDHPIEPKPHDDDPHGGKPTTKPQDTAKPTDTKKPTDTHTPTTTDKPSTTHDQSKSDKATTSKTTSTTISTSSQKETSSHEQSSSDKQTSSGQSTSSESSTSSGKSSSQSQSSSKSSSQSSGSSSSSSSSSLSASSSNGIHKTIVQSSVPQTQTITKTCEATKYPQACAHFYSASMGNPSLPKLTCSDNHKSGASIGPAVSAWDGEHQNKVWTSYVKPQYQNPVDKTNKALQCDRSEWPPAYFLSEQTTNNTELNQRIRYLPQPENSGAAQVWQNFCSSHDGGKSNGQRIAGQLAGDDDTLLPLNPELVKAKAPITTVSSVGKDKITTYETTYDTVTFTRAVLEMSFDWGAGHGAPSAGNNWLLTDNPCWPSDIVPKDPGYVLLAEDQWYNNAGTGFWRADDIKQNGAYIYNQDPSSDLQSAANNKRPDLVAAGRMSGKKPVLADSTGKGPKKPLRRVRREALTMERGGTPGKCEECIFTTRHADHPGCKASLEEQEKYGWCDEVGGPTMTKKPNGPRDNTAVPTLVTSIVPQPAQRGGSDVSTLLPAVTSGPNAASIH